MAAQREEDNTPSRQGHYWTIDDYTALVTGLRDGCELEELAYEMGRTASAVAGRLSWLLPSDAEVLRRRSDREQWLREALADGEGYDWLAVLRSHYVARGLHLFTADEDEQLRTAWDHHTGLVELVERMGIRELPLALRFLQLGLAEDVPTVVNRLGAMAGGAVDVRARLATDRAAAAVWVLVIDGVGDRVAAFDRGRQHISVHPHIDAAMDTAAEMLAEVEPVEQVRYSIAERTVGDGTVGADHHALLNPVDADSYGPSEA